MPKTIIFAGGFGSGKSEIALNYTRNLRKRVDQVVLADLDLVNPYFASRDIKELLEKEDIRVVAPAGGLSFSDIPSIPADMLAVLRERENVVIDLAGDEVGAIVLGYLRKHVLERHDYELLLVINPYRPFAEDLDNIKELSYILERATRIKFTGIVSNPNMLQETTLQTIREGHKKVEQYAEHLKIPIRFITVEKSLYQNLLPDYGELLLPIQLYLRPDYLY